MKTSLLASAVVVPTLAALVACSAAPGGTEDTAQVSAAITAVPTGVTCVAINAGVSEEPLVTRLFAVTAGQSTTLNVTGLPSGQVTFSAFAYGAACTSVTGSTVATWVSDPLLATLASQAVTSLSLVLQPTGSASIGVTFSSCPQGQGSCDGTTCVTLTTDPDNCGECGSVCPETRSPATGAVVSAGVCIAGACEACATGATLCNSGCAALATDPNNCGACQNVCPETRSATGAIVSAGVCVSGTCQTCVAGETLCSAGCASLQTDPNNCGSCAHVCPRGPSPTGAGVGPQEQCVAGVCTP